MDLDRGALGYLWCAIVVVCGVLMGIGADAIEAAIEDQGTLGENTLPLLAAMAIVTFPVAAAVPTLAFASLKLNGRSLVAAWVATIYGAGYLASSAFNAAAIKESTGITCSSSPPGLAVCGVARGAYMLSRVYTYPYMIAGAIIGGGLVVTYQTLTDRS